jgi:hypothetical protein
LLAFAEQLIEDIFIEKSAVAVLVYGAEDGDEQGQQGEDDNGNGKYKGLELFVGGKCWDSGFPLRGSLGAGSRLDGLAGLGDIEGVVG